MEITNPKNPHSTIRVTVGQGRADIYQHSEMVSVSPDQLSALISALQAALPDDSAPSRDQHAEALADANHRLRGTVNRVKLFATGGKSDLQETGNINAAIELFKIIIAEATFAMSAPPPPTVSKGDGA